MTAKKDGYEFRFENGTFYLRKYRDGVSSIDISYSSSSSSENEDADMFNDFEPVHAVDNSPLAVLRKRLERRAELSSLIRKGTEYIFYGAMLPLLGAALVFYALGTSAYAHHVTPIHSAIVNTSTVTYNPKLVEVTSMAVLAESGRKLTYQQQATFKDDINWLGNHPNSWYTGWGITQGGPFKLINPEYYLARVEKAAEIPYNLRQEIAVKRDLKNDKEIGSLRNAAYHMGMDVCYFNLGLLLCSLGIDVSLRRFKRKVDSDDVETLFPSDDR